MTIKQTMGKLENWLPKFFADYHACYTGVAIAPRKKVALSQLNSQKLEDWLMTMAKPLEDARSGAFQCDPWEIAGLGRDEVRNSAVLAWLLNPKGSHGLGKTALTCLIEMLNNHFSGKFPTDPGRFCRVRTEINPNGDISNRVDIEINSENFYLLIEVKINATEGKKQLKRYGDLAENQAGNLYVREIHTDDRPWAIVFLTRNGKKPNTAGIHESKVLPISWRKLSHLLDCLPQVNSEPPKSSRRLMAEQIVRLFLKKIRTY